VVPDIKGRTYGLRVFESRVLRSFGPKKDKVVGGWRMLRIEELDNLCSSSNVSGIVR
jgi:hypothetical protein